MKKHVQLKKRAARKDSLEFHKKQFQKKEEESELSDSMGETAEKEAGEAGTPFIRASDSFEQVKKKPKEATKEQLKHLFSGELIFTRGIESGSVR